MGLTIIFLASGGLIILLIIAKIVEEKRQRQLFILKLISKSDMHVRDLSHRTARGYSELKDWTEFFLKKQLPMQSKSWFNKSQSFVKGKVDIYLEIIRGSKLLRKSDGISEFFQNVSDAEKDKEEIMNQ